MTQVLLEPIEQEEDQQSPMDTQDPLSEAVDETTSLPVFALHPEAAQEWSQGQLRISQHGGVRELSDKEFSHQLNTKISDSRLALSFSIDSAGNLMSTGWAKI